MRTSHLLLAAAGTVALAASLAAVAPASMLASPATAELPPIVLVVHGRGMLGRDTAQLRREWTRALHQGAAAAGDSVAGLAVDFRLVWYADALDPVGSGARPALCKVANGTGASRQNDEGSLRGVLGLMGGILSVAAAVDTVGGSPLRAMAGDLLYFGDARRRCAAASRLDEAFRQAARERRPVVVVAHSFGSFVAYDYLHERADAASFPIARFITLGSLLGAREIRAVLFPGSESRVALRGVGRWINVVDRRDPLARPFGADAGGAGGSGVEEGNRAPLDVEVTGLPALDPHDAASYLRDPATVRAILGRS